MSRLFARGVRAFTVASLLTIVVGVLHTLGMANEAPNEDWAAAQEAMEAATVSSGSLTMSLAGVFVVLWIQVGVLLGLVGVGNMVAVTAVPSEAAVGLARRLGVLYAAGAASMAALAGWYVIPPPLVAFVVLTIAFVAAAFFARTTG